MNREDAFALSDELANEGFSHTITVGISIGYTPRERYAVQLHALRLNMEQIQWISDAAERHNGEVSLTMVTGDGLQVDSPDSTPESLRGIKPGEGRS